MVLDRQLDSEELNQLGIITELDYFKDLDEEFYTTPEFADISCDEFGLTLYGFKQVLMQLSQQQRDQMLTKMGYDQGLYSTQSRVFVTTVHSEKTIKCCIGDNVAANLHELSANLMADALIREGKMGKHSR